MFSVKKNSNPSQNEPLAKLYCSRCPYEHRVINREDLHPILQNHFTAIEKSRKFARILQSIDSGIMTAPFAPQIAAIAASFICSLTGKVLADKDFRKTARESQEGKKLLLSIAVPGARYAHANELTKQTAELIKDICQRGESPFVGAGVTVMLEDFSHGIIDNSMNLILLEHPESKNSVELRGFARFIQNSRWKQPFQRARFPIMPVERREEVIEANLGREFAVQSSSR